MIVSCRLFKRVNRGIQKLDGNIPFIPVISILYTGNKCIVHFWKH